MFPSLTDTVEGQQHVQRMMLHINTHEHTTWHVAADLQLAENRNPVTSRTQRGGMPPQQQLTFGLSELR